MSDADPIRVAVVDDQQLVRAGLTALLDRDAGITVAGEADDGGGGVELVRRERPDVVIMDARMPGVDGVEATARIVADPALTEVRVLVLTTFDDDALVFAALRAGASGFLLKDAEPDALRSAIRTVADGEALLSPRITRRVVEAATERPTIADDAALDDLTERERAVLAEVAAGRTNDEIAAALYMSPATARTHVSRILTKTASRDRAQLVVLAYETGIVTPGTTLP